MGLKIYMATGGFCCLHCTCCIHRMTPGVCFVVLHSGSDRCEDRLRHRSQDTDLRVAFHSRYREWRGQCLGIVVVVVGDADIGDDADDYIAAAAVAPDPAPAGADASAPALTTALSVAQSAAQSAVQSDANLILLNLILLNLILLNLILLNLLLLNRLL